MPDTLTVDVTPDVGSDVPTDVPSLPFRFRIGNALADGATICVQDFEGGNVRIPPVGLLPRGAVSAYSERPMGFVRVSWTLGDVPLSDDFCAGEVGHTTTFFSDTLGNHTLALMGVDDWMTSACGSTGAESCAPYEGVLRFVEVEAPLFMSSPPRIRVLNGSTRGIDTFCFAEREHVYPFGMPPFYESLSPITGIRAGIGACEDDPFFDWPFDPSPMPTPDDYWIEPEMAASSTIVVLDDVDGGLVAVPWRDEEWRE